MVNYSFGNFEVLLSSAPTVVIPSLLTKEITTVIGTSDKLTVATLDLDNIDPGDGASRFTDFANMIVTNLLSPDVRNCSTIQDNNGPTNNAVVDLLTRI